MYYNVVNNILYNIRVYLLIKQIILNTRLLATPPVAATSHLLTI